MSNNKTYTRKEISSILSKASEIQKQNELYGNKEGLTEQELLELAHEVGIDQNALLEAIDALNNPNFEQKFNWFKATSKIQDVSIINGELNAEDWSTVIAEIRKVTGGIGKTSALNNVFEWEQRKKDKGYKHITLIPKSGKTKVQIVNSWNTTKAYAHFISMISAFVLTAYTLDSTSWSAFALFVAPVGALIGLIPARIYLYAQFKKQKKQVEQLVSRIRKTLQPTRQPQIDIEADEIYADQSLSPTNKTRANS